MVAKDLPYGELIRDVPTYSTSVRWAAPIDERLNGLVKCAIDAGENTNRAELIAALVLAAKPDAQMLGQQIRALRLATVGHAVIQPHPGSEAKVLRLSDRKPGRRRS